MRRDKIYDFLLSTNNRNLVITFVDGDLYDLADIDLCYSIGRDGDREYEPLRVPFQKCKETSKRKKQALKDGKDNTPGIFWTTIDPIEPVEIDYDV